MFKAKNLFKSCWNPIKYFVRYYSYPEQYIHLLKNLPQTQITKLSNGLTVATEERTSLNACVGFFIDAGSRYECEFENGIAHFFEHLAFKGTRARTRGVLEEQISASGAKFHCFTTRELVAYYAECLNNDLPFVLDLLADCIFNNCLSQADIESQKSVVYCEMKEYDIDTNALCDDYLHSTAFQGTPLAQTVLGPSSNLYNFNEGTIQRYLQKYFDPTRTVLVGVGGIKHDQLVNLANLYLSKLEPSKCVDDSVYRYTGSEVRFRNDELPMATVQIAVEGPCLCDSDYVAMEVAASLLGGWDSSQPGGVIHASAMARGTSSIEGCEAYKSFYKTYKDTSLWGVKFLATSLSLEDICYQIQSEWMRLCTLITDGELQRAKRELKTRFLVENESCLGACLDTGKWVLYNGYRPQVHEKICAVDRVHAKDVKEACMKYVYDVCPVIAAVGPTEGLPDYTRIRSGMYWLRV